MSAADKEHPKIIDGQATRRLHVRERPFGDELLGLCFGDPLSDDHEIAIGLKGGAQLRESTVAVRDLLARSLDAHVGIAGVLVPTTFIGAFSAVVMPVLRRSDG